MNRLEVMTVAARKAGSFLLGQNGTQESTQKSNAKDFVTVADIKSQDILRAELGKGFPGVVIVSEEDDEAVRQAIYASDFTGFVIDPIDGTYNFKRGMRESAISVGYIEAGQAVCGVIYDPYKDELFSASKGGGALCNGQPIHVSNQVELGGASVATSNGYDDAAAARNLKRQLAIYERTSSMPWTSCPGSAVLTMAWLAAGRIDAFHHNSLKPWDNAAAFLLVSEAGGIIETLDAKSANFTSSAVLMATPLIQAELRKVFDQLAPELLQ